MLKEMFSSKESLIMLSIILGFGLATMFQRVCTGGHCVVIQGPAMKDVKNIVYRIDDTCYKYTPYVTKCE